MTPHKHSSDVLQESWQRQTVLGLLPLLLGIEILTAVVFVPTAMRGNADFRQFYAGGYMVRTGLVRCLYDPMVQAEVENRVVSPSAQVLPINHPSYEYLFFAPLSILSYNTAYLLWVIFNLAVLIFCGFRLERYLDPWLAVSVIAGFAPVATAIMHGQDSICLLLLFLLSLECDDLTAGLLLGLGAFRFHVIIPVMIVYLLWKRWRFVGGLLLSGGSLAALSVLIVGVHGSLAYIKTAVATTQVRNGAPADLYGFLQVIASHHHLLTLVLWCGCAIVTLWYASRQIPTLEAAVLVVPLVSYHLMLHDLVILIIPIALRIRSNFAGILQFVAPICGLIPQFTFIAAMPSALLLCNPLPRNRLRHQLISLHAYRGRASPNMP